MRCRWGGPLACAIAAGAAWWGLEREAAACQPQCTDVYAIESAHREVARDGVLVFRMSTGGSADREQVFEALRVEVRTTDGAQLAGELRFEHGFLVWAPACTLRDGETLSVTLRLDRGRTDLDDCDGAESTFTPEAFEVVSRDLSPIGASSVCFRSLYAFEPGDDVDSLVCCDGAYPYQEEYVGSCDPDERGPVMVDEGACLTRTGTGSATSVFEFAMPSEESDAANLVARLVFADGSTFERLVYDEGWVDSPTRTIARTLTAGTDVRFELISLATGQVFAGDAVRSDADAPTALGPQSIDVQASLDATCDGPPYVCSSTWDAQFRAWNPDDCEGYSAPPGIDPDNIGNTDPGACTPYALEQVEAAEPTGDGDTCLVLSDRGCTCRTRRPALGWVAVPLLVLVLGGCRPRRG